MQFGDLSNKVNQAVVINADLIGFIEKKYLGLKKELVLYTGTKRVFQELFESNINIYIVCSGELTGYVDKLEKELDYYFIPYTRIYPVTEGHELALIVNDRHVMRYYYFKDSPFQPLMSLEKFRRVVSIEESYRELGNV